MAARVFGEIPGNPPGTEYADRREASDAGVHRPLQGGICGGADGAESVVVSGGYVDDLDYGDEIIYTGHGGRDPESGLQVADQDLLRGNLGLARNYLDDIPVRVVRGYQGEPALSPAHGYRYDGMFTVSRFWQEIGKDGFRIWRYRLVAIGETAALPEPVRTTVVARTSTLAASSDTARNLEPPHAVKEIHDRTCQVCGLRILTPAGPHAVAVYVQARAKPHQGPSSIDNLLCLCPNDAVRFKTGAIFVDDAWTIHDALRGDSLGQLRLDKRHAISTDYLRYHRERFAGSTGN